ncbi:unnamed protein product [Dracunculus medinensis]|uniref:RRM domain-containing protein n=1 Tax=Dracunculus medinensis TaxID=318479 RepID=A0A0N4U2Y3_DRAME|nr:unnamed protein product [Dracunculus medinensis]
MPRRGFAFVSFNDPNVTAQLAKMRDFVVNGVSVCVTIPTPRKRDYDPPPRRMVDPFSSGYGGYNDYPPFGHSGGGRGPYPPKRRRRGEFNDSWL